MSNGVEDRPVEAIHPGDRVFFEPGEDHRHGAAPNRFVTHLAVLEVDDEGASAAWGEHGTDDEYSAAPGSRSPASMSDLDTPPRAARAYLRRPKAHRSRDERLRCASAVGPYTAAGSAIVKHRVWTNSSPSNRPLDAITTLSVEPSLQSMSAL